MNAPRFAMALCGALLIALPACERKPQPTQAEGDGSARTSASPATQPATQPAASADDDDLAAVRRMAARTPAPQEPGRPPGHPPLGGPGTPPPTAAGAPALPVQYDAPTAWKQVPPEQRMRVAQYSIARVAGDNEDGVVAVFFFAGSGGTVEDNVKRWVGQFVGAGGQPIDQATVHRETFPVGPFTAHFVELTGHYHGDVMKGGSGTPSESPYRLLGAIVETPGGKLVFKATGPEATLAAAREDFIKMLKTCRP